MNQSSINYVKMLLLTGKIGKTYKVRNLLLLTQSTKFPPFLNKKKWFPMIYKVFILAVEYFVPQLRDTDNFRSSRGRLSVRCRVHK